MPKQKNAKASPKPKAKKEYPDLNIKGVISKDSQPGWRHGIGVWHGHDPKTGEPRILLGNTWYPQKEDGTPGEIAAPQRGAASLEPAMVKKYISLLEQAIEEFADKKPKTATQAPTQPNAEVIEKRANELADKKLVEKLKSLGMDDEQISKFTAEEAEAEAVPVAAEVIEDDDDVQI